MIFRANMNWTFIIATPIKSSEWFLEFDQYRRPNVEDPFQFTLKFDRSAGLPTTSTHFPTNPTVKVFPIT